VGWKGSLQWQGRGKKGVVFNGVERQETRENTGGNSREIWSYAECLMDQVKRDKEERDLD